MDSEEDELVAEFDVELSRQAAGTATYMLGFPLRPANLPIGTERRVVEARFRPKQRRIELDLELETKEKKEDSLENDGMDEGQNGLVFDPVKMEKMPMQNRQTFGPTCNMPPPKANYTAGVLDLLGKKLVLTPLDNVTQLQPKFGYIDKEIAEQKKAREDAEQRKRSGVKMETSDEEDKEDQTVEVGVSFKRRETEQAAERRKNSYAFMTQKQDEEEWIKLEYAREERDESKEAFSRSFSTIGMPRTPFSTDTEYISNLGARLEKKKGSFATPVALRELRSMQLTDLIPTVMRRVKILDFDSMREICGPIEVPDSVILATLEKCASLLRGVFVVRSSSLGLSVRLGSIRDLILGQFRKSRVLRVADIMTVLGVSVDESILTGYLAEVATKQKGQGWSFKFDDDVEFLARHRVLEDSHAKQWESREETCRHSLGSPDCDMPMDKVSAWLRAQLRTNGAMHISRLRAIVDRPGDGAGLSAPHEEILSILDQRLLEMTIDIRDIHILRVAGSSSIQKFRGAIIELFRAQEMVKRADAKEAMLQHVGEDAPDSVYIKIMRELGVSKGNAWQLKDSSYPAQG